MWMLKAIMGVSILGSGAQVNTADLDVRVGFFVMRGFLMLGGSPVQRLTEGTTRGSALADWPIVL